MTDFSRMESPLPLPVCKVPEYEGSLYDRPNAAPSPFRMFEVASGRSRWTAAEKAWLALNPRWIEHDLSTRSILKEMKAEPAEVG